MSKLSLRLIRDGIPYQELVMMLVYRIIIPLIAMFGIVGNILNIIVLRFASEIITIMTMRTLTMVVVFVVNANLFNLSQSQFKDSVYFFLKVATSLS